MFKIVLEKEMHDFVDKRYRLRNGKWERNIFVIFCSRKRKRKRKLVKNYLVCTAERPSNYRSVRIGLLNFTADEDTGSFLELFFVETDKDFFEVAWKMAKGDRTKNGRYIFASNLIYIYILYYCIIIIYIVQVGKKSLFAIIDEFYTFLHCIAFHSLLFQGTTAHNKNRKKTFLNHSTLRRF